MHIYIFKAEADNHSSTLIERWPLFTGLSVLLLPEVDFFLFKVTVKNLDLHARWQKDVLVLFFEALVSLFASSETRRINLALDDSDSSN